MKKTLILSAGLALLAGCQNGQPGDSKTFAPLDPAQHETWQLVQGQAHGKPLKLQGQAPITLIFSPDGLSGRSPVNHYQAPAKTGGGKLQFTDEIMTTLMAAEPPAMHLERDYLQALRDADSWQREGNQLIIRGQGIQLDYTLQGTAGQSQAQ